MTVNLAEKSYEILFEKDFNNLPDVIRKCCGNPKVMIVTDRNVDFYYGDTVKKILKEDGFYVAKTVIEPGENNKTLDTVTGIYNECINNLMDRNSVIIALGGGIVGDIAGFAASTYMRGINFIQLPTSLLAQIDSSVGGKVGVNLNRVKNIIGSFYQPKLVYTNINCLKTLPKREFTAGFGEVIKHAVIRDSLFFNYLEENYDKISNFDYECLKYTIMKNCMIKASVVENDEKELNERAVLNFGHTIGHAIETAGGFKLVHGEAVAVGIHAACIIANAKNLFSLQDSNRVINLLKKYKLPLSADKIDPIDIYSEMLKDKKQIDSHIKFILPTEIGKAIQVTDLSKGDIMFGINKILDSYSDFEA